MQRRRAILKMQSEEPSGGKIWLIKEGVEITENTGGIELKNTNLDYEMGGWGAATPVKTQGNGYLRFTITGSPKAGSIWFPKFYLLSEYSNFTLYADSEMISTGSGTTPWMLTKYGNDGINYRNYGREQGTYSFSRQIMQIPCRTDAAENPSSIQFAAQISSRSTTNWDFYNLWLE